MALPHVTQARLGPHLEELLSYEMPSQYIMVLIRKKLHNNFFVTNMGTNGLRLICPVCCYFFKCHRCSLSSLVQGESHILLPKFTIVLYLGVAVPLLYMVKNIRKENASSRFFPSLRHHLSSSGCRRGDSAGFRISHILDWL